MSRKSKKYRRINRIFHFKLDELFNQKISSIFDSRKTLFLFLIALIIVITGFYLGSFNTPQTGYVLGFGDNIGIKQINSNLTISINPSNNGVLKYVYIYKDGQAKETDIIEIPGTGYIAKEDHNLAYIIPKNWSGKHYIAVYSYSKNDWIRVYFDV